MYPAGLSEHPDNVVFFRSDFLGNDGANDAKSAVVEEIVSRSVD